MHLPRLLSRLDACVVLFADIEVFYNQRLQCPIGCDARRWRAWRFNSKADVWPWSARI